MLVTHREFCVCPGASGRFGLLMDVGLGCDEGGGGRSEEQIVEPQNGLGWKGT